MYEPVTPGIFDLDGFLLETEPIYENAVQQICQSFGTGYTVEVKMKGFGCAEQHQAAIIIAELALPISVEDFVKRMKDIVREDFRKKI